MGVGPGEPSDFFRDSIFVLKNLLNYIYIYITTELSNKSGWVQWQWGLGSLADTRV